jgi:hypothetical protein
MEHMKMELTTLSIGELINRCVDSELRAVLAETKVHILEQQVTDLRQNADDLRCTIGDLRRTINSKERTPSSAKHLDNEAVIACELSAVQNGYKTDCGQIIAVPEWLGEWKADKNISSESEDDLPSSETIENKCVRRSGRVTEKCTDRQIIARRTREIERAKDTSVYKRYISEVPKCGRPPGHPRTPDKTLNFSRRSWDSQVRRWKLQLHAWEEERASKALLETAATAHLAEEELTALKTISLNHTF